MLTKIGQYGKFSKVLTNKAKEKPVVEKPVSSNKGYCDGDSLVQSNDVFNPFRRYGW